MYAKRQNPLQEVVFASWMLLVPMKREIFPGIGTIATINPQCESLSVTRSLLILKINSKA